MIVLFSGYYLGSTVIYKQFQFHVSVQVEHCTTRFEAIHMYSWSGRGIDICPCSYGNSSITCSSTKIARFKELHCAKNIFLIFFRCLGIEHIGLEEGLISVRARMVTAALPAPAPKLLDSRNCIVLKTFSSSFFGALVLHTIKTKIQVPLGPFIIHKNTKS